MIPIKLLFVAGDGGARHRYWDSVLQYADSPVEIEVFGHLWKKDNYF